MAKSVKHVFILILAFQTEGLRLQYHLSQGKHVRCTDLTLFFFADTTKLYIPFQTFGDLHPAAYICIALLMLVHLSPLPSPLTGTPDHQAFFQVPPPATAWNARQRSWAGEWRMTKNEHKEKFIKIIVSAGWTAVWQSVRFLCRIACYSAQA